MYRQNFPNVRASISTFFQFFGGKLPSIDWKLNKFFEDLFFTNFFPREKFQKHQKPNHVVSAGSIFTSKNFSKNRDFPLTRWGSMEIEISKFREKNSGNRSLTSYPTMLLLLGNSQLTSKKFKIHNY